jgi:hypothetical protein
MFKGDRDMLLSETVEGFARMAKRKRKLKEPPADAEWWNIRVRIDFYRKIKDIADATGFANHEVLVSLTAGKLDETHLAVQADLKDLRKSEVRNAARQASARIAAGLDSEAADQDASG